MFLSRRLLGPPKSPRNVFFPWFNFIMAKTGTYLEPNRAAFRVPVHLTKPEIQNYLREAPLKRNTREAMTGGGMTGINA
ncbi:Hypothetical protein SCF082_LOCUS24630 [Durusdinium trenchii]|uniref:Uncharacterized protein n=1 Tax=Durusdinium trenchii TaxID=1381693 RepID=A0ABP0LWQ0_9DINO